MGHIRRYRLHSYSYPLLVLLSMLVCVCVCVRACVRVCVWVGAWNMILDGHQRPS
jgi:hypothetical protein